MSSSSKPLVVYYSRTGNTRVMARTIAGLLRADTGEIISRKKRSSLLAFTCVFDQLFDRDDDYEPLEVDIPAYDPLIIAGPIWIHKLASPVRTFLKSPELRGKTIHLFVCHSGNYFAEDADRIRAELTSRGMFLRGPWGLLTRPDGEWHPRNPVGAMLKGIHTTFTADKLPEAIEQDTISLLHNPEQNSLLSLIADNR